MPKASKAHTYMPMLNYRSAAGRLPWLEPRKAPAAVTPPTLHTGNHEEQPQTPREAKNRHSEKGGSEGRRLFSSHARGEPPPGFSAPRPAVANGYVIRWR